MPPVTVFLFDIDGTLISSGGAGKSALEATLVSDFGIEPRLETLSLSGRTDRAIVADLLRLHALEPTPEVAARLVAGYLRHLPDHMARKGGCVLPGIASLLAHLDERHDVVLGLLTGNIRAGARIKLGHFGLFDYFGFGGFGDEHLDRDDVAREALAEVTGRHDGTVMPERVWVIGDTPLDVQCARAIGARVAAIATGWHDFEELASHRPDLLLTDLSDPTPLLRRIDG